MLHIVKVPVVRVLLTLATLTPHCPLVSYTVSPPLNNNWCPCSGEPLSDDEEKAVTLVNDGSPFVLYSHRMIKSIYA
jgi:hypothetical protein